MQILSTTRAEPSTAISPLEIMRQCPRFARCSTNCCPLDPEQNRHRPHPKDRERVCPMEQGVRKRIGSKYPDALPLGGLTRQEHAGALRWSKLGSAEQEAFRERGIQALAKSKFTAGDKRTI